MSLVISDLTNPMPLIIWSLWCSITKILTSVFSTLYTHVEFRKIRPIDYKLFQVADLICTMELLEEKAATNSFSRSETDFFGNVRDFKKNYLKHIKKKTI